MSGSSLDLQYNIGVEPLMQRSLPLPSYPANASNSVAIIPFAVMVMVVVPVLVFVFTTPVVATLVLILR